MICNGRPQNNRTHMHRGDDRGRLVHAGINIGYLRARIVRRRRKDRKDKLVVKAEIYGRDGERGGKTIIITFTKIPIKRWLFFIPPPPTHPRLTIGYRLNNKGLKPRDRTIKCKLS